MRDFSIQTDHIIEARKPNLVAVDKERSCKIIDSAIPRVSRIEEKEQDRKISRLRKGITEGTD